MRSIFAMTDSSNELQASGAPTDDVLNQGYDDSLNSILCACGTIRFENAQLLTS
jgi:hypothetical protein